MNAVLDRIRTRIVPACLTALGVALLAGGLLSYTNPVTADPLPSDEPSTPDPTPTAIAAVPTPSALISLPPIGSSAPESAAPSIPPDRTATRIRIAGLGVSVVLRLG